MVWNGQPQSGQNSPGQQNSAQQGYSFMPAASMNQITSSISAGAPASIDVPAMSSQGAVNAVAPLINPLQSQVLPQQPIGQAVPAPNAVPAPQTPMGLPQPGARPIAGAQLGDDDQVPSDDVAWVNLSRRAIAESRGDPHRQVQLLQHIRAQYLKQRFGRSVRTDEV